SHEIHNKFGIGVFRMVACGPTLRAQHARPGPGHRGVGRMRIGIDGASLTNRRGFGRFARQMVAALAGAGSGHEFTLGVDRPSRDAVGVPPGFRVVTADVREAPSKAASARGRRRMADIVAMSRAVARAKLDLFYFPASYSFVPVWGCRRTVV